MQKLAGHLDAAAAMSRARQCEAEQRLPDAEFFYRQIIEQDPWFHPAYHALGLLAYRVGKVELAVELISSAIALDESPVVYHRDHGEMCRQLGKLEQALASAERAVMLDGEQPESHYNLGLALAAHEQHESAVASYRRTIQLDPAHGKAWNNLGSSLEKTGEADAAMDAYRQALQLNEGHTEARSNLGSLLAREGQLDEARAELNRVLEQQPGSVATHFSLSSLKRYRVDDPQLAALEKLRDRLESLPQKERTQLYFTLGKARADCGDHERAFTAFEAGNRLQKQYYPDGARRSQRQSEAIIKLFTTDYMEQMRTDEAPADDTPVFVVGMPRSGTSLVEQILSSHSQVYGAGELKDLSKVIGEQLELPAGELFTARLAAIEAEGLAGIGSAYLAKLRGHAPRASRIVDKMPANFFYLGLIALALPGAKIIHTARDPMDSCLSCYCRFFNDTMDFSYDLEDLGNYYACYHQLMQHWTEILPAGCLLTVRYEDLVADQERYSRAMLEHIGLPWEPQCLDFHVNQRPVRTASLAQVRQPVYSSSVGAWKRYQTQLQPLMDIVGAYR